MSARIYDANGDAVPVRVMRRRMGFMGGDLLPDDERQNEPPSIPSADREIRARWVGDGSHQEETL